MVLVEVFRLKWKDAQDIRYVMTGTQTITRSRIPMLSSGMKSSAESILNSKAIISRSSCGSEAVIEAKATIPQNEKWASVPQTFVYLDKYFVEVLLERNVLKKTSDGEECGGIQRRGQLGDRRYLVSLKENLLILTPFPHCGRRTPLQRDMINLSAKRCCIV
jgi:hypothetical protein